MVIFRDAGRLFIASGAWWLLLLLFVFGALGLYLERYVASTRYSDEAWHTAKISLAGAKRGEQQVILKFFEVRDRENRFLFRDREALKELGVEYHTAKALLVYEGVICTYHCQQEERSDAISLECIETLEHVVEILERMAVPDPWFQVGTTPAETKRWRAQIERRVKSGFMQPTMN